MPQSKLNLAPVSLLAVVTLLFALTWSHDHGVSRPCQPVAAAVEKPAAPSDAESPLLRPVSHRSERHLVKVSAKSRRIAERDPSALQSDWLVELLRDARRTR